MQLIERLWQDFLQITPDAPQVHTLLKARGEEVINDHIAFRTFNCEPISLDAIASLVKAEGYQYQDSLYFREKHLKAQYFLHPNSQQPKIFISELLLEELSYDLQTFCRNLAVQASTTSLQLPIRPWEKIAYADYQKLMAESEYAAWVAAFGLRANHFTVSLNYLNSFNTLEELNEVLRQEGFSLNDKGGEVKGSVAEGLKQSSTMAKPVDWEFSEGTYPVMGGYYEFAERFCIGGQEQIFQGFLTESANKIFESTYVN